MWIRRRAIAQRGNDAAVVVARVCLWENGVTRCLNPSAVDHDGDRLDQTRFRDWRFRRCRGETFGAMVRRPFAWRELLDQIWFVARVSIVPTLMLSIPYTVLIVFTLNIALIEVGAGDLRQQDMAVDAGAAVRLRRHLFRANLRSSRWLAARRH